MRLERRVEIYDFGASLGVGNRDPCRDPCASQRGSDYSCLFVNISIRPAPAHPRANPAARRRRAHARAHDRAGTKRAPSALAVTSRRLRAG